MTLSRLLSDVFLHMFWNVIQLCHGGARLLITDMPNGKLKKYHLSPETPLAYTVKDLHCIYISLGFPVPFLTVSKLFFGYHCSLFKAYGFFF